MGRFIDLTGASFGKLTVLCRDTNCQHGKVMWRCLCDCGAETTVMAEKLRSGHTKSCGCLRKEPPHNFVDLTGDTYGRLTVVGKADSARDKKARWECVCKCGNKTVVGTHELVSGETRSCGCLKMDALISRSTKHGKRHTRVYNIWAKMKSRTTCENDSMFKWYGARGIRVCDEWLNDFESFYEWAMVNGYRDSLTIDRIDNDGGYSPDNCRWTDKITQANNKSNNVRICIDGEAHTLTEWCRIKGLSISTVRRRRENGIVGEALFAEPTRR